MKRSKLAAGVRLARTQGLFDVVGGAWPIVALPTFEWVFGRKRDAATEIGWLRAWTRWAAQ